MWSPKLLLSQPNKNKRTAINFKVPIALSFMPIIKRPLLFAIGGQIKGTKNIPKQPDFTNKTLRQVVTANKKTHPNQWMRFYWLMPFCLPAIISSLQKDILCSYERYSLMRYLLDIR